MKTSNQEDLKQEHWFWSKQAITEKEYYELRKKRYLELRKFW